MRLLGMLQRGESAFLRPRESGETILSFLVSSLLGILVISSAASAFFDASYRAFDVQIKSETRDEAKAILDLMAFDLRMMGSGMPLNQANFLIAGTGLGTAPLPMLTDATASAINFRRSPLGNVAQLTADYLPSSINLTMTVNTTSDLAVGDVIYITDFVESGTGGMRATISSKTATTITVGSSYVASAATTFKSGSLVERVQDINYTSAASWSGITRNDGSGAVTLARNSTFTLSFYDKAGTLLVLPLADTTIRDSLASVQVAVSVRSDKTLRNGSIYTATLTQRVGLRNLYLSR